MVGKAVMELPGAIDHPGEGGAVRGAALVFRPAPQPGASNNPPVQGPRVQSMATEVAAGATTPLTWANLKPGTYLLE